MVDLILMISVIWKLANTVIYNVPTIPDQHLKFSIGVCLLCSQYLYIHVIDF